MSRKWHRPFTKRTTASPSLLARKARCLFIWQSVSILAINHYSSSLPNMSFSFAEYWSRKSNHYCLDCFPMCEVCLLASWKLINNNLLFCRQISLGIYPVALDASAELLDKRALTSMIQYSSDLGWRAYCMLHSPTMPRWRTTWWNKAANNLWGLNREWAKLISYFIYNFNNEITFVNHFLLLKLHSGVEQKIKPWVLFPATCDILHWKESD